VQVGSQADTPAVNPVFLTLVGEKSVPNPSRRASRRMLAKLALGDSLLPPVGQERSEEGSREGEDLHGACHFVPPADMRCYLDRTQEIVIPL